MENLIKKYNLKESNPLIRDRIETADKVYYSVVLDCYLTRTDLNNTNVVLDEDQVYLFHPEKNWKERLTIEQLEKSTIPVIKKVLPQQ